MQSSEYKARRARLRAALHEQGLNALVVTSLVNVRYLSGFTGSSGALLLARGRPLLFTDSRYQIQAAEQTDCAVRITRTPPERAVAASLLRRRGGKFGFEDRRISLAAYRVLESGLPAGSSLAGVGEAIERLRMVKSPAEIERLRASAAICSEACRRGLRRLRAGGTERELAARLEFEMGRLGAEKPAFETIVAAGARSALPHAEPGENRIGDNELVLIDMGAQRRGYASDMTRVAHIGRPTRKIRRIYDAVLEAQRAALDTVRPGATAAAVDRVARRVLRSHKLDELFTHSTGHGLGLEIHELPRVSPGDRTRLEPGMAITVEPGVYIEGFGGIRIEDTVLVTSTGYEVLTPLSKELRVI